jgi:tRNA A37 threonylcarbamoyladenosine biosynthesis protein TsaE
VRAAVEKEQGAFDADAARIDDAVIVAEWPERVPTLIERQQLTVTRTVRARGARDQKSHRQFLSL